jgi:hypothetical protein
MAIQVITLRKVFDRLFAGKNTVDYDVLCQMMSIDDTFNQAAYTTDSSFSTPEAAMINYEFTLDENGQFSGFILYARTIGAGGRDVWTQVMNPDARIPSSVELYLKKAGTGNQEGYVQVYSLRQLNLDSFLISGTNRYQDYYADVSTRAAGALYALSCYQRKIMELHIRDIGAVNNEQMEVNRILSLITTMKNNLTQDDVGISGILDRHTVAVDPDVLAFFSTRGLLDDATTQGKAITSQKILALRRVLLGEDTSGSLGRPDDFEGMDAFIRAHVDDPRIWGESDSEETSEVSQMTATQLNEALQYLFGENSPLSALRAAYAIDLDGLKSTNALGFQGVRNLLTDPAKVLDALQTVFYTPRISSQLSDWALAENSIFSTGNDWSLTGNGSMDHKVPIFNTVEEVQINLSLPKSLFDRQGSYYDNDDYDKIGKFVFFLRYCDNVSVKYTIGSQHSTKPVPRTEVQSMREIMEFFASERERLLGSEEELDSAESELVSEETNSDLVSLLDVDLFRDMLLTYFDVGYTIEAVDSTGDFTLSAVGAFKAWVYLHMLLKYQDMFLVSKRGTIDNVQDCDVYDPRYWKKASEVATNARKGMVGIGDHWIYAGDSSVRWFGNNPPAGAADFEAVVAGTLARSYGGIHFANPRYFTTNFTGQWVLTDEFKTMLKTPTSSFAVMAVNEEDDLFAGAKKYFFVDFEHPDRAGSASVISVGGYNPGNEWNVAGIGDAYSNLLVGSVHSIGGDIKLNGEDCVFWQDTASMYTSQIVSLASSRLSDMQMALQMSQQSVNVATSLCKSVARTAMETVGNTR